MTQTAIRVQGRESGVGGETGVGEDERAVPASKYVHDTGVPRLYFCARGEALRQIEQGQKKRTI